MQNKIVMAVVLMLALIGAAFCVLELSASVMTYPIAVDLPQRVTNPLPMTRQPPLPIHLRVDAGNRVYWNNSPEDVNELQQKMEKEVQKDPTNQPELRINASPDSVHEVMTRILAQARNAGVRKIGFAQ